MTTILNIDTATETAQVSLGTESGILASRHNELQKDHASFLQPAIVELFTQTNIKIKDIDAVAVTGGPGSYTGLRVGLASAKGLCFSLSKPLIVLNTLQVLAASALQGSKEEPFDLLCPMIDARRMEIYTALYDKELTMRREPNAMTLNPQSFAEDLSESRILFFGSGSTKWQSICNSFNANFKLVSILPVAMNLLSFQAFTITDFKETAYIEPLYLKEFQTVAKR